MEKYAILGYPLKHTMSPQIHKRLFELEGKAAEYEICEIPPEELPQKAEYLSSLGGYNITIPYKVDIIKYLDGLDVTAKRYNSVNCVVTSNGKSVGHNTDCTGFLRSLSAEGMSLGGRVLQIGCGGVGRMIAAEAALHGADLTVVVLPEFVEDAERVAEEIRRTVPEAKMRVITHDRIEGTFDLLINASPVGMYPKTEACPVTEDVIKSCGGVFDVIYNPDETRLMALARANGIKAVGGMAMLVWQAVVAHEIWSGAKYRDEDVFAIIDEMRKDLNS